MTKFIKSKLYAIICLLLISTFAIAQNVSVSGTVVDNSGPLPGVNVVEKGTLNGVITDLNGKYSLTVSNRNAILTFSFIGYITRDIPVANQTSINVTMAEDAKLIDEVVVVAYGTQKVTSITGSMAKLNTDELSDMPVATLTQKMQGKLPGVQILQSNGDPTSGPSIRIRGQASINGGNTPLLVIDGYPSGLSLAQLSPDEIENLTVLKDAASASLYGSRAANGVILVTTKQAKKDRINIEFSANYGTQRVSNQGKPDMMNAREFAQFKKEYYEDAMKYEGRTAPVPDCYANPASVQDGTDWFSLLLRPASVQNYNFSLSAGQGRTRSSVNLNYSKNEGVILNTWSDRITLRSNNIFEASDMFTFGVNLSGVYRSSQTTANANSTGSALGEGRNIIESAYLMDPQLKYKNDDGTYNFNLTQPDMFDNPNWYLVLMERENPNRNFNGSINSFMDITILKGLKYKLQVGATLTNSVRSQWIPSTAYGAMFSKAPGPATGFYQTNNGMNWQIENLLTYNKSLGKHNFDLLAGYSTFYSTSESSEIRSSNFPDDELNWYGAATTRQGQTGSKSAYSMISYFGRVNYDFDGKYLLQLALRSDGCSRFGANKKYATFPSVSAGWIMSNEEFIQHIEKLSYLKLRGSWGVVGNHAIGNYDYLANMSGSNYVFGGTETAGRTISRLENNDLTWETSESYDFGIDIGLFRDRIFLVYDYYWKKTNGLFYQIELPQASGFSNIYSNIGEFHFWGHEINIETRNLVNQFKWSTNVNMSFPSNKAVSLGTLANIGGNSIQGDFNRTEVGRSLGNFYGFVCEGVFMTQAEYEAGPKHVSSMVGTVRMKDLNGDGVIDMTDRTWIGNPNPTVIYGITNTFGYKNFDASIVMMGSLGNDIMDQQLESTENLDGVFNVTKRIANRWRSEDNPGDGIIPRTRSGTTELARYNNTMWVSKGNYLRINNLTLGYTVPLKNNPFVKGLRIYGSAQNLLTLTTYKGMNPEVSTSGSNGLYQGRDTSSYPVSRTYSIGFNLKF